MENQTFRDLNLNPEILKVLDKMNFKSPTPIQFQSIPVALKRQDIIGIAQTGTGKTLSFGLPLVQNLMNSRDTGLVILPTRELALQVKESLDRIARNFNMNSAVLIGGDNINRQIRELNRNPKIIISTPGRLEDHMKRGTINLVNIKFLVLDEADRMLDMGFAPTIKKIIKEIPQERQTMLFSATMPDEIIKLANKYMKSPLRVEVAPAGSATDNVTHEIFFVNEKEKLSLLKNILEENRDSVLVFSRTKHGAKKIAFAIRKMGYTSTEIHSNRTLRQRLSALKGFKTGQYRVMVATDIAARGIDVKDIGLVINYNLPEAAEDYVHRIGRTGRGKSLGHAISFATPKQRYEIRKIEKLIKQNLPVSKLPELEKIDKDMLKDIKDHGDRNQERPRGRGNGSNGRNNRKRRSNSSNSNSNNEKFEKKPYNKAKRRGNSNNSDSNNGKSEKRSYDKPKRRR